MLCDASTLLSYYFFNTVRLTEVYYECSADETSSFFGAVGVSSGTVLSVKVAAVLFLTVFFFGRNLGNKKTGAYKTYGIDEREEVT